MKEKPIIFTAWVLLTLAGSVCHAQDQQRDQQAVQVKSSVTTLRLKDRPSVAVIRRDLSRVSGNVTAVGEEDFVITRKGPSDRATDVTVRYRDVLEMSGGGIRISFAPDPRSRVHGDWDDVKALRHYTYIGVVLKNGKDMYGRFAGADEKKLTLLGQTNDAVLRIPSDMVTRVFGYSDGKNGVKENTRKGLKVGSEVGAPAALIVAPVATGVGALIGLGQQKQAKILLVFAR
jgi:hypothetical protein